MSEYFNAALSDAPIVYYRCDEQSGTLATDSSGNGYDGVLQGVTSYGQTGAVIDDTDTALLMNGTLGALIIPYTVDPTTWTKYTLEFWIKITGGWQHVVVTYDGTTTIKYLNGVVYTSGSGDAILIDQSLTWAGTPATGSFDEIALYNSVVTSAQVAWHYSVGITGRAGIYRLAATYRRDVFVATTYRRGA